MAARYDFYINQGTTWSVSLTYKDDEGVPIDISNYTAKMQVRPSVESSRVLLELSTENGKISIDGPNGRIQLQLEPADTTNLGLVRRGVYDLELTSPSLVVDRLLEGVIYFNPEVTR
ncbi:MAG: hypothetical protein QXX57_00270 [Nitrososphaerota archaeon]